MPSKINIETSESQPLILLPTFLNGKGPFKFTFDTGAAKTILTEKLADSIGIKGAKTKDALGAGSKKVKVSFSKVNSISVDKSEFKNFEVGITNDLPECIGEGVLGYDFLRNFVITIDSCGNVLILTSPSDVESTVDLSKSYIPFKLANPDKPIILVDAVVNNLKSYQFVFDTGASHSVVSPGLANQMNIKETGICAVVGAGGNVQSSIGVLKSLSTGETKLENMSVIVSDIFSNLNQMVNCQIDGILGYNFLKNFKIELNYPQKTLGLKKLS